MSQDGGGFNFVAMLTTGSAAACELEVTRRQQFIVRQGRWMRLISQAQDDRFTKVWCLRLHRALHATGHLFAIQVDRLVTTNRLEVQDEDDVAHGHDGWHDGS